MKALSGVQVLDLTRALAGPYCTLMLGDYGADVIKIELPGRGDDTRHWGPPYIDGESAYFLSINRNKRSLTLNLKDPAGREVFMRLTRNADVVVENFTPGVVNRLGIDYEAVKAENPRIVYSSISGFGQTGPYREKPAYDQMMQGLGGIMSLTGDPDGQPQKIGVALADIGAGMLAAYAVMTALFHRERTGVGQYIDVSMLDLQVAWLTYQAATYFATDTPPPRVGAAHPNLVPYQAFKCADGKYINVAVGNERFWQRFCKALGREDLVEMPEYAQNKDRVKNRDQLVALLQQEFDTRSTNRWVDILEEAGVPCGPINDLADVFSDPQVKARDMLLEVQHPSAGKIKQTGIPIKFSATPGSIDSPPPLLGQHSKEILLELGYSQDEVEALEQQEVI
ncbi:MAG: CaiB/BaiF CoA-transferase family protein [Dehalococcoidia bacterium]|nr:CaiB/BaiF CoA-transferase family protein [Chloroflexota bacterium]